MQENLLVKEFGQEMAPDLRYWWCLRGAVNDLVCAQEVSLIDGPGGAVTTMSVGRPRQELGVTTSVQVRDIAEWVLMKGG